MEVYVISFCIASWQLGAVVAYVIHNYCFLLQRLYESLGYAGLIERTESNCFRVQASAPFTLLIFIGSFFLLFASFLVQMYGQYKKNREYLEELMDEETKSDFWACQIIQMKMNNLLLIDNLVAARVVA